LSTYKDITDRIVAKLESGDVEAWRRPWTMGAGGVPHNGATGRSYRGINTLILVFSGYSDPRWYTYNQVKALGGSVKKGEKGTQITFFKVTEVKKEVDGKIETKKIPLLRCFTVFNHSQSMGLPEAPPVDTAVDPSDRYIDATEAITATGAVIHHGGSRAYYSPSTDTIVLPEVAQFESLENYLSTAFHELGHWTAKEGRSHRKQLGTFGTPEYAKEELVAELTSAFLCGEFRISGSLQHESYIQSWLTAMKADPFFLFAVAGEAQRAADYIIGCQALAKVSEDLEEAA